MPTDWVKMATGSVSGKSGFRSLSASASESESDQTEDREEGKGSVRWNWRDRMAGSRKSWKCQCRSGGRWLVRWPMLAWANQYKSTQQR